MTQRGARGRAGADRWLVSYADFVTLLLAFFATVYAISDLNAAKTGPAASAIRRALGSREAPDQLLAPARAARAEPTGIGERLAEVLSTQIARGRVEMVTAEDSVVLSLPEAAAFASGSASLNSDALEVLTQLAQVLVSEAQTVRVEGHTDDVPITSVRFTSNWELSTARASAVVAFLIEQGVDPARLAAAGYGQFHPRVPNDSAAARALNRRVDIVLMSASGRVASSTSRVAEPGE
jgi:chemotaxis protein MotB